MMKLDDALLEDPSGRCLDQQRIAAVVSMYGMRPADADEVVQAHALAKRLISADIVALELFEQVHATSGAAVLVFKDSGRVTGVLGMVPLQSSVVGRLANGTFDGRHLQPVDVAVHDPACIYIWAAAAETPEARRAVVKGGKALIATLMWDLPLFARAETSDGRRVLSSFGFVDAPRVAKLMMRLPASDAGSQHPATPPAKPGIAEDCTVDVRVDVAHSINELLEAIALRAMVYVQELGCPFHEEFDGNDVSGATHLIARQGNEPCGVLRIRWFGSFAKIERVAVRADARGADISGALFARAWELAAMKGFTRVLAYIEPHLLPLYRKQGFLLREDRESHHISDRQYIEVLKELPAGERFLSLNSDPLVLLRPEGTWEVPGVLDLSSLRKSAIEDTHCQIAARS